MSIPLKWKIYANVGSVDPTVTLSDPTGQWGVRRKDTQSVTVSAGTAMVKDDDEYTYTVTPTVESVVYEYYVKVVETDPYDNTFYVYGTAIEEPDYDLYTLGGVIRMLVKTSGRADLVVDADGNDYTDAGYAVHYVNQAQDWLDRRLENKKTALKLYKTLSAGESLVTFARARYVTAVWDVTDLTNPQPLQWAPVPIGLAPDQADLTELAGSEHVVFGNHWPTHGIVVPVDEAATRTLLVEAGWYNGKLVNYEDRSFWTVNAPMLLVWATMYMFEVGYRASQGQSDFLKPIMDDLQRIYFDLVQEEAAGPPMRWRMR